MLADGGDGRKLARFAFRFEPFRARFDEAL
jgi:hypothetical protein